MGSLKELVLKTPLLLTLAYLSARAAITKESMPPEYRTATLACWQVFDIDSISLAHTAAKFVCSPLPRKHLLDFGKVSQSPLQVLIFVSWFDDWWPSSHWSLMLSVVVLEFAVTESECEVAVKRCWIHWLHKCDWDWTRTLTASPSTLRRLSASSNISWSGPSMLSISAESQSVLWHTDSGSSGMLSLNFSIRDRIPCLETCTGTAPQAGLWGKVRLNNWHLDMSTLPVVSIAPAPTGLAHGCRVICSMTVLMAAWLLHWVTWAQKTPLAGTSSHGFWNTLFHWCLLAMLSQVMVQQWTRCMKLASATPRLTIVFAQTEDKANREPPLLAWYSRLRRPKTSRPNQSLLLDFWKYHTYSIVIQSWRLFRVFVWHLTPKKSLPEGTQKPMVLESEKRCSISVHQ